MSIRPCTAADVPSILGIVNDAAQAYKGVIPADRWHEPYLPPEQLQRELADGVRFWGYESAGQLIGVMGLQNRGEVALVRHVYVRTALRNRGIGAALLKHVEASTTKPMLIGTWAAATCAIAFYRKNGYCLLRHEETVRLLMKYWRIPERQMATSVVLAGTGWKTRMPRVRQRMIGSMQSTHIDWISKPSFFHRTVCQRAARASLAGKS
jgi:N-acetylglutamate synthase-like GNAT family acetyltransferase